MASFRKKRLTEWEKVEAGDPVTVFRFLAKHGKSRGYDMPKDDLAELLALVKGQSRSVKAGTRTFNP